MSSTKVRYEQRSTLIALESYLTTAGYSNIKYTEGYQSEDSITNPQISVTFPPSRVRVLQMGKVAGKDKMYIRRIQVDAYMESEPRTQAIIDDIMDFMADTIITIVDPSNNTLGTLLCNDEESIYGDTMPPILENPKFLRYHGVARGEYEAFYPG